MKICEDGYFIQGEWFKGIPPTMIGKSLIRTKPCTCISGLGTPYLDYSYCLHGLYCEQPDEWINLIGIIDHKYLVIEWEPTYFPGKLSILEEWWNDGNWIEWNP